MSQTTTIERLTVLALMEQTGLRKTTDSGFFPEWQTSLPDLSEYERDRVARIQAIYENFELREPLENTVGLTVISPLLDAAGLFFPPFHIETEKSVEIVIEDRDLTIKGRLDALIIQASLWVLTIEAKRAGLSLISGLPQVLAYMIAAPTPQKILYGMVTNGSNFLFVKLDRTLRDQPVYGQSAELIINRDNDLERTLQIIKRLASIISESA